MKNPFTEHPNSVGESYFNHMGHALSYFVKLLFITIVTFVHAFFPFLFVNTASTMIKKINKHLENRLQDGDKE
jgi:hypothetical protein|tara:strand:+ start:246 stop:464 length:219 start_codon:yes stop_codon:yes gene_type:complete